MAKAQVEIGKRTAEEIIRLFPTMKEAEKAICGKHGHSSIYSWMQGGAPSAKYLQRLYFLGADIPYILSGRRSKR